jgi:uracil-DNA glycosylase
MWRPFSRPAYNGWMIPRPELEDILRFYADAGADEALVEAPVDRFADGRKAAEEAKRKRQNRTAAAPERSAAPSRSRTVAVPDEAQAAARANSPPGRPASRSFEPILSDFDGCNLRLTAKNLVFADGNPQADLMLVGEAPGRDEDLEGLPFVGRSGRLLDRMLAAIGRDRHRPTSPTSSPGARPATATPRPIETEICRPFIERQIELVAPRVLVTLGNPSTKLLLGAQQGIMRMRGKWQVLHHPSGAEIAAMPTLHPAYLLRNPAHKKLAWQDFLEIRASWPQAASPWLCRRKPANCSTVSQPPPRPGRRQRRCREGWARPDPRSGSRGLPRPTAR